jgi:hypothetical protein
LRPPNASFEDILCAEFPPDATHIYRPTPILKRRITRNHKQGSESGQLRNDVFREVIRKVFLLGITAHILNGNTAIDGLSVGCGATLSAKFASTL